MAEGEEEERSKPLLLATATALLGPGSSRHPVTEAATEFRQPLFNLSTEVLNKDFQDLPTLVQLFLDFTVERSG